VTSICNYIALQCYVTYNFTTFGDKPCRKWKIFRYSAKHWSCHLHCECLWRKDQLGSPYRIPAVTLVGGGGHYYRNRGGQSGVPNSIMSSTFHLFPTARCRIYKGFLRSQRYSIWRRKLHCFLKHSKTFDLYSSSRKPEVIYQTPDEKLKDKYYKVFRCKQYSHVFYKLECTISNIQQN
jgi:hypothetical protein